MTISREISYENVGESSAQIVELVKDEIKEGLQLFADQNNKLIFHLSVNGYDDSEDVVSAKDNGGQWCALDVSVVNTILLSNRRTSERTVAVILSIFSASNTTDDKEDIVSPVQQLEKLASFLEHRMSRTIGYLQYRNPRFALIPQTTGSKFIQGNLLWDMTIFQHTDES